MRTSSWGKELGLIVSWKGPFESQIHVEKFDSILLLPGGSGIEERKAIPAMSIKILRGLLSFLYIVFLNKSLQPRIGAESMVPEQPNHPKGKRFHHKLQLIEDCICFPHWYRQKHSECLTSGWCYRKTEKKKRRKKNGCQPGWEKTAKCPTHHSLLVQPLRHTSLCSPCRAISRPLQAIPKYAAELQTSPDTGTLPRWEA